MTAVVISQPMLFPWPGFFEQLMLADVYLFLDDAQFSKGSFTNRVQVRIGGEMKWLTVPLAGKGTFQRIDQLRESDPRWRQAHISLLRQSFREAPFAGDAISLAEQCYERASVCDVLVASIELPATYLGIGGGQRRMRTSKMGLEGQSWRRVLDLVQAVGGTRYVTGHGARGYLDHSAFEQVGIAVDYMVYSRTPWPQGAAQFSPFVTILDLIANVGPSAAQYLAPATVPWRKFLAQENGGVQ